MRMRLRHLWDVLTSGYWFVPALMCVAAVGLAFGLLHLDGRGAVGTRWPGWVYGGGADGASTLLSTVAGSVVTVAGVAFSITIAALAQAANQFGSRLLRNFMRDTGNQVVLGTFVATFLYCLLILRTVHRGDEGGDRREFVPQASVTVAVALATLSMAMLIYFIHHVSTSLQAPAIVATIAADLERAISRLPTNQDGGALAAPFELALDPPEGTHGGELRAVTSPCDGYVQAVDYDALLVAATARDLVLRVERVAGDHVIEGEPLLRIWPLDRCGINHDMGLATAFIVGHHRTQEQDVEYAIDQMVEVAVRALSPGVNDPFTAINCVDALGSAVCRLAQSGLPRPCRFDAAGRLRLVIPVTTFAGLTDAAFNQIRQYGRGSVAVTMRLLEVLGRCGRQVATDQQRRELLRHAELVYEAARTAIPSPHDLGEVRTRWEATSANLAGGT